jgi:hypothetical protein
VATSAPGKPIPRGADGDAAQHPRRKPPASVLGLNAHGKGLGRRLGLGQFEIQQWQRQAVDRRRLPRHAVVVHRIHAVGRNIHLIERAIPVAKRIDAIDGNAAQGEVFS